MPELTAAEVGSKTPLVLSVISDDLPYRVSCGGHHGAGDSPSRAVMGMLSAGDRIPAGMRDRQAAAQHLLWHYEASPLWLRLIEILVRDKF